MKPFQPSSSVFWKTLLAFTFAINFIILLASIQRWVILEVKLFRSVWIIPLVLYLIVLIAGLILFWWMKTHSMNRWFNRLENFKLAHPSLRILGAALVLAVGWFIPWLKFNFQIGQQIKTSTIDPSLAIYVYLWLVWWLLLLAVFALKWALQKSWTTSFILTTLIFAFGYELYSQFALITAYPLSMGWSEASRYYYASLLFSKNIYGFQLPLSFLHPTRYFLQAIPFLFSQDLIVHRIWQFLLWVGLTALASWSLARRVASQNRWQIGLISIWLFVFWLQMGVYYHLQVMTFLIFYFANFKKPWQTIVVLIIASLWAGMSRVNWFPVPAMLLIAIYLLEEPVAKYKNGWVYLMKPFGWAGLGLAAALLGQLIYVPLSGNADVSAFASSFSSDLIWSRLWPNPSFELGIVIGLLLVAGPLIVALLLMAWRGWQKLHPIRWLGLASMLLVLFIGGLIVSVKIGGGGDLHNMDAFAVLLGLVGLYFLTEQAEGEPAGENSAWRLPPWPVIASGLLIPLFFMIPTLNAPVVFHPQQNNQAFEQLKSLVEQAAEQGNVLFINERHLITFNQVQVPLVADYEAVTLMEMAMSNNQPYLQKFYKDLAEHRFVMIVSGRQNLTIKDVASASFAEENNIWNTRVAPFILCDYQVLVTIEADLSVIDVFVPKAERACPVQENP